MIIDLDHFLKEERPVWQELEKMLGRLESGLGTKLTLVELERFHYLYHRSSSDLAKVATFASEPDLLSYLEQLVARAYSEIHETRDRRVRFSPMVWFLQTWPRTFRRHIAAFWLSVAVTIMGCLLGAGAVAFDSEAKEVILPFEHLMGSPSERVAKEESETVDRMNGGKSSFSSHLMTHNIRVSLLTFGLGLSWGIGTIMALFYNGAVLGAVCLDYIRDGQGTFLAGWLLPHGVIEIPAILLAGQGGFILASALIGWANSLTLKERLRNSWGDLTTLLGGMALMLVWAGLIESFFSQYHEPVLPYALKISFGLCELLLLILFLGFSGRKNEGESGSESAKLT